MSLVNMFHLMGSLKINLYCEDVDFSFLYYSILFYFGLWNATKWHSGCGLSRTNYGCQLFKSLKPERCDAPNSYEIKSMVSFGGLYKSCGCAEEHVFKVGVQDILKVNTAWDTLISQGSRSTVGTALFAGNLRLILSGIGAARAGLYYNCMTFNTPWRDFKFSIFLAYNKSNV